MRPLHLVASLLRTTTSCVLAMLLVAAPVVTAGDFTLPAVAWDPTDPGYWQRQFPAYRCREGRPPGRHKVVVIERGRELAVRLDARSTKRTIITCDPLPTRVGANGG